MRVRVGYTGGTLENPTYQNLGDHTEAFQVDFDPAVMSFETLAGIYWSSHNPCASGGSRQYRNAAWYSDDAQKATLLAIAERHQKASGRKVATAIEPLARFYLAEDYHQKYYLRSTPLWKEYTALYPKLADLLRSPAVTRANAYVAGNGSRELLAQEIDQLGLSEAGRAWLRARYPARR